MFTWICPNCGREVPPSMSECPDCAARERGDVTAVVPPPAATSSGVPPAPVQPGRGLPAWLLSVLFAALFMAIGVSAYLAYGYWKARRTEAPIQAALENPGAPAAPAVKANPLERFIEITGIRINQTGRGTEARVVVVNHSNAEIADLSAQVTLTGATANSDEEAVGTFTFKLPALGAYESKEVAAPLDTKLRVYEMPDWQNLKANIRVTAP